MQAPERRIDDIECLRALAVLGVVVHHAYGNLIVAPSRGFDAFTRTFGLWVGVDLFFAISGFVIGRSFLPKLQSAASAGDGWQETFAFWIRRFFRLAPSAWLWLWLTLLATFCFNRSGAFGGIHANVMATLAGMANIANFRFADAFTHYQYGASFQYWSLSLEEQFYLLLPLCAMIFRRWLAWPVLALILFLALLPMRTVLAMALRTDAIAWGVLLALAWGGTAWRKREPVWLEKPWLRWPILLGLLAAITRLGGDDIDPFKQWKIAAIALLACALVWIASYNRNYLFRPAWLRKPLVWIGARSYAIYLIHIFVFFFVREIASRLQGTNIPHVPGGYTLLSIVLIALLANANYRWIERPLRRFGAGLADRMESKRLRARRALRHGTLMPQPELPKKSSSFDADTQAGPAQPITEDIEGLPFDNPSRLLGLRDAVLSGWFRSDRNELFKGVSISADDVVVDVGCGDGGTLNFCAKFGAHLIAVDADPRNIENVRQRLLGSKARQVECHVSTSDPLPLANESATRVICTEVLEHVDDPVQVLRELFRIGQPGALYVLSVPDALQENLQKLVAPPSYFRKPNHVRIIGRDEFEAMVCDARLEVVSHDYFGFFWSIWFAFYSPRHWPDDARIQPIHDDPLLSQWEQTWKTLLDSENGLELKRKLDSFMPKSQVIIARKP